MKKTLNFLNEKGIFRFFFDKFTVQSSSKPKKTRNFSLSLQPDLLDAYFYKFRILL
jgi:hypothetical protein